MSAETLRSVLEKQLAYASGDQSNHSLYIELTFSALFVAEIYK